MTAVAGGPRQHADPARLCARPAVAGAAGRSHREPAPDPAHARLRDPRGACNGARADAVAAVARHLHSRRLLRGDPDDGSARGLDGGAGASRPGHRRSHERIDDRHPVVAACGEPDRRSLELARLLSRLSHPDDVARRRARPLSADASTDGPRRLRRFAPLVSKTAARRAGAARAGLDRSLVMASFTAFWSAVALRLPDAPFAPRRQGHCGLRADRRRWRRGDTARRPLGRQGLGAPAVLRGASAASSARSRSAPGPVRWSSRIAASAGAEPRHDPARRRHHRRPDARAAAPSICCAPRRAAASTACSLRCSSSAAASAAAAASLAWSFGGWTMVCAVAASFGVLGLLTDLHDQDRHVMIRTIA